MFVYCLLEGLLLTANSGGHDVGSSVEEEKAVHNVDLDDHNRARSTDGKKHNDIHDADGVENHISWTSQGSLQESHLNGEVMKSVQM